MARLHDPMDALTIKELISAAEQAWLGRRKSKGPLAQPLEEHAVALGTPCREP